MSTSVLIDLSSPGYVIGDLTVTCQQLADAFPVSTVGCTLTPLGTLGRYWFKNPNITTVTGYEIYVTAWPEKYVYGIFNPADGAVEGTYDMAQMLRIILAAVAGRTTGAPSNILRFKDVTGTKDRIVGTVDTDGNRTTVVLDGT